jgi:hypothetical protein
MLSSGNLIGSQVFAQHDELPVGIFHQFIASVFHGAGDCCRYKTSQPIIVDAALEQMPVYHERRCALYTEFLGHLLNTH